MISIYSRQNTKIKKDGIYITVELRGLSTDTKPTTIENRKIDNGSIFIEINTGKVYMYDLENHEWSEI